MRAARKSIVPGDQEDDSHFRRCKPLRCSSVGVLIASSDVNEVWQGPPAADSMLRVGFRSVRSRMLAVQMGHIVSDVGRKAQAAKNVGWPLPEMQISGAGRQP
ncbi:hypothetical protein DRO03_05025 [Methanosarcinales archaeon]|nr:MAG: hypothetical protein DRO03_05025 [Methanosarcinales archaeon]